MTADDMLSWLRKVIEGDRAVAEENLGEVWTAVDDRDEGFFIEIEDAGSLGKACGCCITGTLAEVEAKHIALHDPRDTIARCEAELELLDRCERVIANPEAYDETAEELAEDVIRRFASGYRHREGFNPDWLEG